MAFRPTKEYKQKFMGGATAEMPSPTQQPMQQAPQQPQDPMDELIQQLENRRNKRQQRGAAPQQTGFINDYVKPFNEAMRPVGLGIGQAGGEIGSSLLNLIPGVNLPQPDLGRHVGDSFSEQASFQVPRALAHMASVGGGTTLANLGLRGFKNAMGLRRSLGMPGYALGTGATGMAMEQSEDGGRVLPGLTSAAAGSLGAPAAKMVQSSSNYLAKQLPALKKVMESKYRQGFDGLFKEVEEIIPVRKRLKLGVKPSKNLYEQLSIDQWKAVSKFLDKPTFRNAHKAQSQLGQYIRAMKKKGINNELSDGAQKALREAEAVRVKVNNGITRELKANPKTAKYVDRYGEIMEGYKKEAVPLLRSKNLNKFEQKELLKEKLPNSFKGDAKLIDLLDQTNPQLSKALREGHTEMTKVDIMKILGLTGGAGSGGYIGSRSGGH